MRFFLIFQLLFLWGALNLPAQNSESRLRPGDSVILKISGVPSTEVSVVSNSYDIADNGTINLPYIGQFKASGQTPSTLQRSIEQAYKAAEIYSKPTIQITPNREMATQVVFVSGEVRAPGRVPMVANMVAHDCITSAGGPTDFAKLKAVKLTRSGETFLLDLRRADGNDAQTPVEPGDRIHVP